MTDVDGREIEHPEQMVRRAERPVDVIVLTNFDFDEYIDEALQLGVRGFVLKSVTPGDLVTAVRTVAAGQAFLEPSVARKVVDRLSGRRGEPGPGPAHPPELDSLTPRELDVLRCLAQGLSNKEIGG